MILSSLTYRFQFLYKGKPAVFEFAATGIDHAHRQAWDVQRAYADQYAVFVTVSPAWGCYRDGRLIAGTDLPRDAEWTWADAMALDAIEA